MFSSLIQLFGVESQGLVRLLNIGVGVHISLDLRLMFPTDAGRFTDDDYCSLYDLGGYYAVSCSIGGVVRDHQIVNSLNEFYRLLSECTMQERQAGSILPTSPQVQEERDLDDEVIAALKEEADAELDSLLEREEDDDDSEYGDDDEVDEDDIVDDEYGDDDEDEVSDDDEDDEVEDEEDEEEEEEVLITLTRPTAKPTSRKYKGEVQEMVEYLAETFPNEVPDDIDESLLNEVLTTIFEDEQTILLSSAGVLREQLEQYVEF